MLLYRALYYNRHFERARHLSLISILEFTIAHRGE